jgi:hypothetical protein
VGYLAIDRMVGCFACAGVFSTVRAYEHHLQTAYRFMYHDHAILLESPPRPEVPSELHSDLASLQHMYFTSTRVAAELRIEENCMFSRETFVGTSQEQQELEDKTEHLHVPKLDISPFTVVLPNPTTPFHLYNPYLTPTHAAHTFLTQATDGPVLNPKRIGGAKRRHKGALDEQVG